MNAITMLGVWYHCGVAMATAAQDQQLEDTGQGFIQDFELEGKTGWYVAG